MGFYRKITSLFDKQSKGTISFVEAERTMRLQQKQLDATNFIYEADGFTYSFKEVIQKLKWTEIKRLFAYKADLINNGKIYIDITWSGGQITITEKAPGWFQFIERIKVVYPGIPGNWETLIMDPSIREKLRVLYQ